MQQQFFPSSDRAELIIDWNLPQNASIAETNAQMARFEREQLQGNPGVDHWSTYVGTGAPRFVLSFDLQTANTWFGQMVVVTKGGIAARDRLKAQFETYLKKTFPGTDTFVKLLEVGPPVGRPVQYRLSGPDIAKVREFSQEPRRHCARQSASRQCRVRLDGAGARRQGRRPAGQGAPARRDFGRHRDDAERRARRHVDHPGARQHLSGERDGTRDRAGARIDRYAARPAIDRAWAVRSVPLGAVATLRYEIEQPTIWRRSRLPTITLKASILDNVQPKTVVDQLAPKVAEFAKGLPAGYSVAIGGSVEESAKSQARSKRSFR